MCKGNTTNKGIEQFNDVIFTDLVTDNIRKAVECANLIFQREGFKAWKGWVTHCKAKPENVPNIQNCKL